MSVADARLLRLLGGDELAALRARLRQRFERDLASASFTLGGLRAAERQALEGLLGRPARSARSMRLSLPALDEALRRAGLAPDLRTALEALDGPIPDLAARARALAARWDAVHARCRHPRLSPLLEEGAGRGLLKRVARSDPEAAEIALAAAARVLDALPAAGWPRSRLAARILGDAHGLDDGRPAATLVLAALEREAHGRGGPTARHRDLWASAGVLVNELAAPALVLNVAAGADCPAGLIAGAGRETGEPVHLSLRSLLRAPPLWAVRGRVVSVCENPAIVAIAADRLGGASAPLVCTDGMPAAAQRTLLAQLARAGARLRYHGDFDWPGIRIANFVMRTFGAAPWRMAAADYDPGAGRMLDGDPVAADWDEALAGRMAARGIALDEESVADALVDDLAGSSASPLHCVP